MVPTAIDGDGRAAARRVWALAAVMAGALVISYIATGLRPNLASNPALLAMVAAFAGVGAFYRFGRPDPKLYGALEAAGQMLLILLLGLLLTYAAACSPLPYRDQTLAALDAALGLDRRAYFTFVGDSDWLRKLSGYAYLTIQPQIVLVPFALIMSNRLRRLQCFTLAFGLALSTTIVIAALLPTSASHVFADLRAAGFDTSGSHFATYEALRNGALRTVALNNFEGLITFPSFHAAAGVLFTWALWAVRPLRWPILAANAAMIVVAPIHGPHYVIDLPAGIAVATLAILIARRVMNADRTATLPLAATAPAPAPQASQA